MKPELARAKTRESSKSLGAVRVCLLTTGQPSTNPRLVKEADALVEAGFQVEVICAHWSDWADQFDPVMLSSRSWHCTYVGGSPGPLHWLHQWTRLRLELGSRLWDSPPDSRRTLWGLDRVATELAAAAARRPADLYIAHNLGALPAAAMAAARHGSRVGYDAEDLVTQVPHPSGNGLRRLARLESVEQEYYRRCDYLTAASPGIARALMTKYRLAEEPTVILNVFPLQMRPSQLRPLAPSDPLSLYWFSQTIGARRGLEEVLEAMAMSKTRARLHLRGQWQDDYRRHLYSRAASLGIPEHRLIRHPPASPDEMVRLASVHDVGLAVEPGRDDNNRLTISNKILVYLLAGNAVIATRTDGQEVVCREIPKGAYCYRPGDTGALAERIRIWSQDRAALQEARRHAWTAGGERFNWDREKHRFLALVARSLNRSESAPPTPAISVRDGVRSAQ